MSRKDLITELFFFARRAKHLTDDGLWFFVTIKMSRESGVWATTLSVSRRLGFETALVCQNAGCYGNKLYTHSSNVSRSVCAVCTRRLLGYVIACQLLHVAHVHEIQSCKAQCHVHTCTCACGQIEQELFEKGQIVLRPGNRPTYLPSRGVGGENRSTLARQNSSDSEGRHSGGRAPSELSRNNSQRSADDSRVTSSDGDPHSPRSPQSPSEQALPPVFHDVIGEEDEGEGAEFTSLADELKAR